MRRLFTLIALSFILAGPAMAQLFSFDGSWGSPGFSLVSETPTGVEVMYSVTQLRLEDLEVNGHVMKVVQIPGIFLPNDEGAPNLPGAGRYVAIPQGAAARVEVLASRTEVYKDVEIAPAPPIPLETDRSPPTYEKDPAIYEKDAYYPAEPVTLSKPMKIRGVDAVILGVTPFQYNPVTRELIVYKDLRVRVGFIGGNGHFGEDRLRSRFWEPILQGHLLNYSSLPTIRFDRPKDPKTEGYEYVIIVPDDPDFEAWGDTVKAWRQLQGIYSEVFTLSEIGGNSVGAIEGFVDNAYNTWAIPPVAVLLLSDYQSSGKPYGITAPIWNSYCASDNIYADVNGDDLPDLVFGRITAQNATHLEEMVTKFLDYERNPPTDPGFYDHPLVSCGFQSDRWFQLCAEVLRGFFINVLGKNPSREYGVTPDTEWPPAPGCVWSTNVNTPMIIAYFGSGGLGYIPDLNPYDNAWWTNGSVAGINAAINSGAFIVLHRDHGSTSGWGTPSYHTGDLAGLSNDMLPFVFTIDCLTGMYNSGSQCFTEAFHRMEHGALGLIAATEVSYSFVNDAFFWGIVDHLWQGFDPGYGSAKLWGYSNLRPGFSHVYGKYYLAVSPWPSNPGEKTVTYHLFHLHGDAFTIIYTEVPQNLTVSHPEYICTTTESFEVTADQFSIIALTVNGEIIAVAEGTGSPLNLAIPTQAPGDTMIVTVTKANYFRYEFPVAVIDQDIVQDDISDSFTPPNPWTQPGLLELSFEVTAVGCDLTHVRFFSDPLQHESLPKMIPASLVEFEPEEIGYLAQGDTVEVIAKVQIPIGQHEGDYSGYFWTVWDGAGSDSLVVTVTVQPLADIDFDREEVALAALPGQSDDGLAVVVNPNTWDENPDPVDGPGNVDLGSIGYQFTDLTGPQGTIPSSALSVSGNVSSLGSGESDEVTLTVDVPPEQLAGVYTGTAYVSAVSGLTVTTGRPRVLHKRQPAVVKDSLTLEVTVLRVLLLDIVESSIADGVTPPDPWADPLSGQFSFRVTNTGNYVLENIEFASTNLELTDHPPLAGKTVEFDPPGLASLAPDDTSGVTATVSVPIGTHTGIYVGTFSATAAAVDGATDVVGVNLTVDALADLDINDYAGNLSGNYMDLVGCANSVVVGSFDLINPNMMDNNPDPFDGPGNIPIENLDANWSHLWSYGHNHKIHKNQLSLVTPLSDPLPSGDADQIVMQVDIPQTVTPREKTYSTTFEVTGEAGGVDVSDEFTLRVRVVPKGDGGHQASSGFWGTAEDGQNLLEWTDFSFGETGYNIYRSEEGMASFARLNPSLLTGNSYPDASIFSGTVYEYELGLLLGDGRELLLGPISVKALGRAPTSYALLQNYPNPCYSTTTIPYALPSAVGSQRTAVSLRVYDLSGRLVRVLVNEPQEPGYYSVTWDGKDETGRPAAAGIYFYRLSATEPGGSGTFASTKRAVLLK